MLTREVHLFVPKGELLLPLGLDNEAQLEIIRGVGVHSFDFNTLGEAAVRMLRVNSIPLIPVMHEEPDGSALVVHSAYGHSYDSELVELDLAWEGGRPSHDGIRVQSDQDAVITNGALSPDGSHASAWWGLSTFDLTLEDPDHPLSVYTVSLEELWGYHQRMYPANYGLRSPGA